MARAKRPESYPPVWFEIAETIESEQQALTFHLPCRDALNERNTFYSFRKALYAHSRPGCGLGPAEISRYSALYRALASCEVLLTPPYADEPDLAVPRTLTIRPKALSPRAISLADQLRAQLSGGSTSDPTPGDIRNILAEFDLLGEPSDGEPDAPSPAPASGDEPPAEDDVLPSEQGRKD